MSSDTHHQTFTGFSGPLAFCSNFYTLPFYVPELLMSAMTSEHAFNALKTLDPAQQLWVMDATSAREAKARGRRVTLRGDWDHGARVWAMHTVLRAKFANAQMAQALLGTGTTRLVETNTRHDQFWGDCCCARHAGQPGTNMLGELLMALRTELRTAQGPQPIRSSPTYPPLHLDKRSDMTTPNNQAPSTAPAPMNLRQLVLERTEQPQADGYREWLLYGELHRADGPAVEYANGTREWWLHDKRHRVDGPAIELADGTREWFLYGELHRADGPAIEWGNGTREWWLHGERHRADGPAIELADGYRAWFLYGERHRVDGPAIELGNGTREWWLHDKRHRVDGPAIERSNGYRAWWLYGERLDADLEAAANAHLDAGGTFIVG